MRLFGEEEAEIEKKRNPSVTLIVTVYNDEFFLRKCLKSIKQQTYENLQVIAVDDGSTDSSGKICDEYARKDIRFTVVHKGNGGVSSARNAGIEKVDTDLVGFIDSDDLIGKHYVEELVSIFLKTESNIAMCGYSVISEKGEMIRQYVPSFDSVRNTDGFTRNVREMMDKKFILSVWGKLYQKKKLDIYNIRFDQTLNKGEDLLFNLEVIKDGGSVGTSSYAGYYYRMHDAGSLSRTTEKTAILNAGVLFSCAYQFCNNRSILKESMYLFSKYYFKSLMFYVEGNLSLGTDSKRLKDDIQTIFSQEELKEALGYKNPGDLELLIYDIIFSVKSVNVILLFAKCRMWFKKKFRGY